MNEARDAEIRAFAMVADAWPATIILEYLARELGLDEGDRALCARFSDGALRVTEIERVERRFRSDVDLDRARFSAHG